MAICLFRTEISSRFQITINAWVQFLRSVSLHVYPPLCKYYTALNNPGLKTFVFASASLVFLYFFFSLRIIVANVNFGS